VLWGLSSVMLGVVLAPWH